MSDLIDYAGLFPPARLGLRQAATNFVHYQNSEHGWMLGRFVVPASLLEDLDSVPEFFVGAHAPRLSILPARSESGENPIVAFKRDMGLIAEFVDRHAGRATVDSIEWPWPVAVVRRDRIEEMIDEIEQLVRHVLSPRVTTFIECPWQIENAALLSELAGMLARSNQNRRAFGLKLRTGGLTRDLVPTPDDVARFIMTSVRTGVPFKATAGLHHPVRNFDSQVGETMFGFLNIFIGAALALSGEVTGSRLLDVLKEDDGVAFQFDRGVSWNDARLTDAGVREGRQLAVSFGSCSFDEPVADLKALGLL